MHSFNRLSLAAVALGALVLLGAHSVTQTRAAGSPINPDTGVTRGGGATGNGGVVPNKEGATSTTTLVGNTIGQTVTLTAIVACVASQQLTVGAPVPNDSIAEPSGIVDFFVNGGAYGSVVIVNGAASITIPFPTQPTVVFASYEGDEVCGASISNPLYFGAFFPALPFGVVAISIAAKGCGTTNPPPGTLMYFGQATQVTALPCNGGTFLGWTGGPCNGTTQNPCDIAPDGSTIITANFSGK